MYKQVYYNLCKTKSTFKEEWKPGSNLHRHHIVPKHSGGSDDEDNLTYLTIREHILAHYLLWKIYKNPNDLRSMHMLGANLSSEKRRIVGKWCRDNNIGFHGANSEDRKTWSRRGAMKQIHNKMGIHNPEDFKKNASLGGKAGSKSQMKSGIAIFDESKRSEYASLGGKSLIGMICVTNGTHRTRIKKEKLDEYLSNGYVLGFTLSS
jgi:hypothetical protein